MSWAGLANNQCVSFTNLKDAVTTGVFTAKNTQSTGSKQITRTEAENLVKIYPVTSKSYNQLVTKGDLIAIPKYTIRLYGARALAGTATLYYGINDSSCPLGGASLTTAGELKYTLSIEEGSTLWIQTRNSSDVTCVNCIQDATNSYCSTYETCSLSYYITSNKDISIKAYAATTC